MKDANWMISLGQRSFSVKATMPMTTNILTVYVDEEQAYRKLILIPIGELCRFVRDNHEYVINNVGLGHLGKLKLYVDGREASYLKGVLPDNATQRKQTDEPENEAMMRIELVEAERVEENLGNDVREIDNSNSNSQVQRRITLTREWSQSVTIEHERARTIRGGVDIKVPYISSLKLEAEQAIRDKYSTTQAEKKVYSEEVLITVPARTRTEVIFTWKQVWQNGLVRIYTRNGQVVECPYHLSLEPIFDQKQLDRTV